MGLFSRNVDYNLILENILDKKRFSTNTKSLFLSMIYKIETSYSDYAKVKRISKTKDKFLSEVINIISEYVEMVKTVEPKSEDGKILKKYNVLAITNEREKTILSYPTESALLYAVSDIEPKYYYIENYIFKNEFQEMLVEGNNLNDLEVIEDFTGWSWNPKSVLEKNYLSNLIYQNLIMLFGMDFMDLCKKSQSQEYDIIEALKKNYKDYYNKLTEVIYIKNKNKKLDNHIRKCILDLKEFENVDIFLKKLDKKKEILEKNIEKINYILGNENSLKKSFLVKNSKLEDNKKFKDINSYIKFLNNEKRLYITKIKELQNYENSRKIAKYRQELELYKNLLKVDKDLETAIIELQLIFIKLLYKKSKEIQTKEEFIDIIYKVRYYRNIFVSKYKSIKDYEILEENLNRLYKKIITIGTEKSYMRMISLNIKLNSEILINCLNSTSMEIENLRLKLDIYRKIFLVEVYENKIFERKFDLPYKVDNPELMIKKNKFIKIFV